MILTNSLIASGIEEINFPQEITLEKEKSFYRPLQETNEKFLYAFTPLGAMQIGKINTAYLSLLDLQIEYEKKIKSLDQETGFLETELQLQSKNTADYKLLYEIVEIEKEENLKRYTDKLKDLAKIDRKNRFKLILISTGTGIVGLSIGLILGAFIL